MSERRKQSRTRATHPISLRRVDRDPHVAIACRSENVSDCGMAIRTQEALAIDETLAMEITADPSKPVIQAVAKVAWCRRNRKSFLVGLEFLWIGSPMSSMSPSMMPALPWSPF